MTFYEGKREPDMFQFNERWKLGVDGIQILRCVQAWAISFKGDYNLGYVGHVYQTLKKEGESYIVL